MWPISKLEIERRRAGLTIKKLAEKLKVSNSLVCQIEKGARKPYPKFKRGVAEILGVPEKVLFEETRSDV